jgi:hypothetical protein
MVAVLNFVPYLGALTGIICMTVGAVLSFDSLGYALIFPAVYLAFGTLEGSLVTPLDYGTVSDFEPSNNPAFAHFLGLVVGNRRRHFSCADFSRFQNLLRSYQTDGTTRRVSKLTLA